ncbi:hypothetical protein QR680_001689 [Steinernema hermaphroditum]|uniref:Hint domain-containing protein n=1 Tax=Steinernema hermaphroditum TaxID=289476 RepID=A0AA39LGG2_9BILA|nr:hypothetical protein QR680_001689 [Steinernema hermaphroditum]
MLIWVYVASIFFIACATDVNERRTQCGEHAAPSGLFIDKFGIPELICETPICFLSSGSGKVRTDDSVTCSNEFTATVCKGTNEWTGGLMDSNNGTHRVLKTECCEYSELSVTKRPRKISLQAGESFRGGPVKSQGQIAYFDFVKEVRKLVSAQNKVRYEITVQRMPCSGPEVEEKLNDPVDRDEDEYQYVEDEKPYDYMSYNRHYRGGLRKRYGGIRTQYYHNRERSPRRRMFGVRREQLFPLQTDDYDFYESDLLPIYSRRSRKPVYVIHGRPRTYATETNYNAMIDPSETILKETVQSNSLPNIYNIGSQPAPMPLAAPPAAPSVPSPANQQIPQGYITAVENTHYPQPPSNIFPTQSAPNSGCASGCSAPSPNGAYPIAEQSAPTYRAGGYNARAYNGYSGYGSFAGAPDLNSAFASLQCFSGDMTVQTPSGIKLVKDLQVGDMVLSIQESLISYSPVVMHLHKAENEDAVFNRIITEDGYELELTDYHLIYSSKCGEDSTRSMKLVQAYKVREGHCVYVVAHGDQRLKASKVVSFTKIEGKGIYAPLTATGDILVSNVLASCHTNIAAQTLQQTFFSWWRALERLLSRTSQRNQLAHEHDVPFGVGYLTSIIDLLVPTSFFI